MDDRYFAEEMNYLLDLSKEFSLRHPDKAQLLYVTDARSRNRSLERLLESFAFLTGRIRETPDGDFPQIAVPEIDTFKVAFTIQREWPSGVHLSAKRFRLHMVSSVNLYLCDAVPIRLNSSARDYPIRVDSISPEYYQVYSVDKVDSSEGEKINRNICEPLYAPNSIFSADT